MKCSYPAVSVLLCNLHFARCWSEVQMYDDNRAGPVELTGQTVNSRVVDIQGGPKKV